MTKVLKYYLSPGNLTYKEYIMHCDEINALGWENTYTWPAIMFNQISVNEKYLEKAVKGIGAADLFIAVLPAKENTLIETGMAYAWCKDVFVVDKSTDIQYYPGITHVTGDGKELVALLRKQYLYIVNR